MKNEAPNADFPERLDVPSERPIASIVLMLVGLGLLALVLINRCPQELVIVVTAAPISLAIILLLLRRQPLSLQFRETGFRVLGVADEIPYSSIQAVTIGSRSLRPTDAISAGDILVVHEGGTVQIPRQVPNVCELYAFLANQVKGTGSRQVNAKLGSYLEEQLGEFDQDLVWTFRARSTFQRSKPPYRLCAVFCWCLVVGIAFLFVIGNRGEKLTLSETMSMLGLLVLIGSLLVLLVFGGLFAVQQMSQRINRNHSVVMGPRGIAMSQGSLFGELVWVELTEIHYGKTARSFQFSSAGDAVGGLRLDVAGASFYIADVYDRPLWLIHDVAQRFMP